jgi:hypothetical protein
MPTFFIETVARSTEAFSMEPFDGLLTTVGADENKKDETAPP